MCRAMADMAVAVFAKAPVAGYAKTRLAGLLGADGAADLQRRLIERTLATARAAGLGPVTLWCAPDAAHPLFQRMAAAHPIALRTQTGADLGERMHRAFEAASGPLLLIGTDCPALKPRHLRQCARLLAGGAEAALIPSEDGGYVLIGLRRPEPSLFRAMAWGSDTVMAETRQRLRAAGLSWAEPFTLWDLDEPGDYRRAQALGLV
jgi:uncharacterized protein